MFLIYYSTEGHLELIPDMGHYKDARKRGKWYLPNNFFLDPLSFIVFNDPDYIHFIFGVLVTLVIALNLLTCVNCSKACKRLRDRIRDPYKKCISLIFSNIISGIRAIIEFIFFLVPYIPVFPFIVMCIHCIVSFILSNISPIVSLYFQNHLKFRKNFKCCVKSKTESVCNVVYCIVLVLFIGFVHSFFTYFNLQMIVFFVAYMMVARMLVSESYLRITAFSLLLLFYARNLLGNISIFYSQFLESIFTFFSQNRKEQIWTERQWSYFYIRVWQKKSKIRHISKIWKSLFEMHHLFTF